MLAALDALPGRGVRMTSPREETSHDSPHVARPRLRELRALPAAGERQPDQDAAGKALPGNQLGRNRPGKRAVQRAMQDALGRALSAAKAGADGADVAAVLQDALRLYASHKRTLASHEPAVLVATMTFARNAAIASYLAAKAIEAGLTTDRGLQLLEAAQKSEQRSERADLHASVQAERFNAADRDRHASANPVLAQILAAGSPTGERER